MPSFPWLHGEISQEEASELVMRSSPVDGQFLVRLRQKKPEDLVLSVIYKGKPTHHLITQEPDGSLVVNKRKYGDCKEILSLVKFLNQPTVPGWPAPLVIGVDKSGNKTPTIPQEGSEGAAEERAPAAVQAPEVATAPVVVAAPAPVFVAPVVQAPPSFPSQPSGGLTALTEEDESEPVLPAHAQPQLIPQPQAQAYAQPQQPQVEEEDEETAALLRARESARRLRQQEEARSAAAAAPPTYFISGSTPITAESVEEAEREAHALKIAAEQATRKVAEKKAELQYIEHARSGVSGVSGSSGPSSPAGRGVSLGGWSKASSTSDPTVVELNKTLAKAVIKLGARVTTLEKKVDELTSIIEEVRAFMKHKELD